MNEKNGTNWNFCQKFLALIICPWTILLFTTKFSNAVTAPSPTPTATPSSAPSTRIPTFLPSYSRSPSTKRPSATPSRSFSPSTSFLPTALPEDVTWQETTYVGGITSACMSSDGSVVLSTTSTANQILYSTNYGQSHDKAMLDDPAPFISTQIACSATGQYAVIMSTTAVQGGKRSIDYGVTYVAMDFSTITKGSTSKGQCAISADGSVVFVISNFFARSADYGVTFVQTSPPSVVTTISATNTYLSSDRRDVVYLSYFTGGVGYLYKSTDFGLNWGAMTTPAADLQYVKVSFDVSGTYGAIVVLKTDASTSIMISSNSGATWTALSFLQYSPQTVSMCQNAESGRFITVTESDAVYSSTDYGVTFSFAYYAMSNSYNTIVCDRGGGHIVVAGSGNYVLYGSRNFFPTRQPTKTPSSDPTIRPSATPTLSSAPTTSIPTYLPTLSIKPSTRQPTYIPSRSVAPSLTIAPTQAVGSGLVSYTKVSAAVLGRLQYLCMSGDGTRVIATATSTNKIVYSSDGGKQYQISYTDDTSLPQYGPVACSITAQYAGAMTIDTSAGSGSFGGKRSLDYGATWTPMSFAAVSKTTTNSPSIVTVSTDGRYFVALGRFLARSVDYGANFNNLAPPNGVEIWNSGSYFSSMTMDRANRLFVSYLSKNAVQGDYDFSTGRLFKSIDYGTTWVEMNIPQYDGIFIYHFTQVSFDLSGMNGVASVLIGLPDFYQMMYTRDGTNWFDSDIQIGIPFCQDFNTGRYITTAGSSASSAYTSTNYGQNYVPNEVKYDATNYYDIACDSSGEKYVMGGYDYAYRFGTRAFMPTETPTNAPTVQPSYSVSPTQQPTVVPSVAPSKVPTVTPSRIPSGTPSVAPSAVPSVTPSSTTPSILPSASPSIAPTVKPSATPSVTPSAAPSAMPTVPVFNMYTAAGTGVQGIAGDNVVATSSKISYPEGVFVDSSSSALYFAETARSKFRKIDLLSGINTIFAGTGIDGTSGDDGPATSATFKVTQGICVTKSAVAFVSDSTDHKVRKIVNGIITTFVGTGTQSTAATSSNGDSGSSTSATLFTPYYIAVDTVGNLFVVENGTRKVRKINFQSSIITTVAGTGLGGVGGNSGFATSATLTSPTSVFVDSSGIIYLACGNQIRRIGTDNIIVLYAGLSDGSTVLSENVGATATGISTVYSVWANLVGDVFFTDVQNRKLRMVSVISGLVNSVAGTGTTAASFVRSGVALTVSLMNMRGLWGDSVGRMYVADRSDNTGGSAIRVVYDTALDVPSTSPTIKPSNAPTQPVYMLYTVIGTGIAGVAVNGAVASISQVTQAHGLFADSTNNGLYITEINNYRVLKIDHNANIVNVFAGVGTVGSNTDLPNIPATSAKFTQANGVCGSTSGVVYISDGPECRIRKVDSAGIINSLAGTGAVSVDRRLPNGDGGAATSATFNSPFMLAVSTGGDVYVGDNGGQKIRRINVLNNVIELMAGTGDTNSDGDGGPATSGGLNAPWGLFVDTIGRIFVVERGGNRIRLIVNGQISLFGGRADGSTTLAENVPATTSGISQPVGLWGNTAGDIYYGETGSSKLRVISAFSGLVTTIAGTGASSASSFVSSGDALTIPIVGMRGIAGDSSGRLFYTAYSANPGGSAVRGVYASTATPSAVPSVAPTAVPSMVPSAVPSTSPSILPSAAPSVVPSFVPSVSPSILPSVVPSVSPSTLPSAVPSIAPTLIPSTAPSIVPSRLPTVTPSLTPSAQPSLQPSILPSCIPTATPSNVPSNAPTCTPSSTSPSILPTQMPSMTPSLQPSVTPSVQPSVTPIVAPSRQPSATPSVTPSVQPTVTPSVAPSVQPSVTPTVQPSVTPSVAPSVQPSVTPSVAPSRQPSATPSVTPSVQPAVTPSVAPSVQPSVTPTVQPSVTPSRQPSVTPSVAPSWQPSATPSVTPSVQPSVTPTVQPSVTPSRQPSVTPSVTPSVQPSVTPSVAPSVQPSVTPSIQPSATPIVTPSVLPSATPSLAPNITPTIAPSLCPSLSLTPTIPSPPSNAPTLPVYMLYTVIGTGTPGTAANRAVASESPISNPMGLFIDSTYRFMYMAELGNFRVLQIDQNTDKLKVFAGTGDIGTNDDSPNIQATSAMFTQVNGVSGATTGDIFMTDGNEGRIRKVETSGIINTIAGNGESVVDHTQSNGSGGPATSAPLGNPYSVAVAWGGNIYFTETGSHKVRRVNGVTNQIQLISGTGLPNSDGDAGLATSARLNAPWGLHLESTGRIFISEANGNRIRVISAGFISLFAGRADGNTAFAENVAATSSGISQPVGLWGNTAGDIYFGALGSATLRFVSAFSGLVCTIAGTGEGTAPGFFSSGFALSVPIVGIRGVAGDGNGRLFYSNFATTAGGSVVRGIYSSTVSPSVVPTTIPSSAVPTITPSVTPSAMPSLTPSLTPSVAPSVTPSVQPSATPSVTPSVQPSATPSVTPSLAPSFSPSVAPSVQPSVTPSVQPSEAPSVTPSVTPSISPSTIPSRIPTSPTTFLPTLPNNPTSTPTVPVYQMFTVAGNGIYGTMADDAVASSGSLKSPTGVFLESTGNFLFIAELSNAIVRKVNLATGISKLFAGTLGLTGTTGDGGQATGARLDGPQGIAGSTDGVMYVGDCNQARVRKIALNGIITMAVGTGAMTAVSAATLPNGDGGPATAATLRYPRLLAMDTAGNLYIAEQSVNKVRKVDAISQIITTIAGTGAVGSGGDNGFATSANIYSPFGVFVDNLGKVYITEKTGGRVRMVQTDNIIRLLAGVSSTFRNNVPGTSTSLSGPQGIWGNTMGDIFYSDTSNGVVRVLAASSGLVTSIAGTVFVASSAFTSGGLALSVPLIECNGIFGDSSTDRLYIADSSSSAGGSVVRGIYTLSQPPTVAPTTVLSMLPTNAPTIVPTVAPSSAVKYMYTVMGIGIVGIAQPTDVATSSALRTPEQIFVDKNGENMHVVDKENYQVRSINLNSGVTVLFAGSTTGSGGDSGQATSAKFRMPIGVSASTSGVVFISDYSDCRIRRVATDGIITTYVGGASCIAGLETALNGDGGAATSAVVYQPIYVALDSSSNLYICDGGNHKVRKIDAITNIITTIAGTGVAVDSTGDGLVASSATFRRPGGIFVDSVGKVYISHFNDNKIRVFANGLISTFLGNGASYANDCPFSSARLSAPTGIWGNTVGDIYWADQGSRRLKVAVAFSSLVRYYAGSGATVATSFEASGQAMSIPLLAASGVSGDMNGKVFVADAAAATGGSVVRAIYDGTKAPSASPTTSLAPSDSPSVTPSATPTLQPTTPTVVPSVCPTIIPTQVPSNIPSVSPTSIPTRGPTQIPTQSPSNSPTHSPTQSPSQSPSLVPIALPTVIPSIMPTQLPTIVPSQCPSVPPTTIPSVSPTGSPTVTPSHNPTFPPSATPSITPTENPTRRPTCTPSQGPSQSPSVLPSQSPSVVPTSLPTTTPSISPSTSPTLSPTVSPTSLPSAIPSVSPTVAPTLPPSYAPCTAPSVTPSTLPSILPSGIPTSLAPMETPTITPTVLPTVFPTTDHTIPPTKVPSETPSEEHSIVPSSEPNVTPSCAPSTASTEKPSPDPTCRPSEHPSCSPTVSLTLLPTATPSASPSFEPSTAVPSMSPSVQPSQAMGTEIEPSSIPSSSPTVQPRLPTHTITAVPSVIPSHEPSCMPTDLPTLTPTTIPTTIPSIEPTVVPTLVPSTAPSIIPSFQPSLSPSVAPSLHPSQFPSAAPSHAPTFDPTCDPSYQPTTAPSTAPSTPSPTLLSQHPSHSPTQLSFGSFPTNASISVVTFSEEAVARNSSVGKMIVLPFLRLTPTSDVLRSEGFYDIFMSSEGSEGTNYIIFGNITTERVTLNDMANSAGFSASPAVSFDYSGRSVSNAGDINGDGYDDLIIGVPYAARCYVLFGTAQGFVNMTKGFTIFGQAQSLTGWSVSGAGDLNNDTFVDLIIGAPYARSDSSEGGAVYVIYGQRSGFTNINLAGTLDVGKGLVVYGAMAGDALGMSVGSAGDVNGDGYDDIVVGALKTNAFYQGGAYIVYGSGASVSMNVASLQSTQGFAMTNSIWTWSGYSVSGAGDVNGDGFDDVLIGSVPFRSSFATEVSYLVYGAAIVSDLVLSKLTSKQGVVISGGGVVVSGVGHINHDGCDDIMIGSNFGFASQAGFVLHPVSFIRTNVPSETPSATPTTQQPTVKQSSLPTIRPSRAPTTVPTIKPSRLPSIQPSFRPTVFQSGPSEPPTQTPTNPTSLPSSTPTISTENPTSYPSSKPSSRPTSKPTMEPSITSISPSIAPSTEIPTVYVRSKQPMVSAPSAVPTRSQPHIVHHITQGGNYQRENAIKTNYVIDTADNVTISGVGAQDGDIFTVLPEIKGFLQIEIFNNISDKLNLTSHRTIHSMSDLVITSGSVIITFPTTGQRIRLANLTPLDISENNFMFSQSPKKDTTDQTQRTAIFAVAAAVGLSVIAVVAYVLFSRSNEQAKRAKAYKDGIIALEDNPTRLIIAVNDMYAHFDAYTPAHHKNSPDSAHNSNNNSGSGDKHKRNNKNKLFKYSSDSGAADGEEQREGMEDESKSTIDEPSPLNSFPERQTSSAANKRKKVVADSSGSLSIYSGVSAMSGASVLSKLSSGSNHSRNSGSFRGNKNATHTMPNSHTNSNSDNNSSADSSNRSNYSHNLSLDSRDSRCSEHASNTFVVARATPNSDSSDSESGSDVGSKRGSDIGSERGSDKGSEVTSEYCPSPTFSQEDDENDDESPRYSLNV